MTQERWLTVEEVAERLRAHPDTVRRWLREGRLKGKMIGGRKLGWRISESELAHFMKEQ